MGRHSAAPAVLDRPEGGHFTGPVTDPRLFDLRAPGAPAMTAAVTAAPATVGSEIREPAVVAGPTPGAPSTVAAAPAASVALLTRLAPLRLIEPADRPEAHSASELIAAVRRATAPMAIAPQTPPLPRHVVAEPRPGPRFTGGPTPAVTSRLVAASLSTAPRRYVAPLIDEPVRVPRAFRRGNRNNSVQFAACALAVLGVVSAAAVLAPQSRSVSLAGATGPYPATAPIPVGAAAEGARGSLHQGRAHQGVADPVLPERAAPAAGTASLAGRQSALLEPHTAQVGAPIHDAPAADAQTSEGQASGTTTGGTHTGGVTVSPPLKSTVPASSPHASASPAPTASSSPSPTPSASTAPAPSPSASAAPVNPPSTGGGSLRAAVDGASRGKVLALGAGTFDFSNFGSNLIGVDVASSIAGISGDSESTTVLQMTPHSSTKQGSVPTTHWKTNQLSLLRVSGSPTLKNFTLLATAQGHLYNGLRLNHTSNATITNVRVTGVPGNSDIPPGETFGINDFHTSGSNYSNVEVDGNNVGASGFATNGSSNVSITGGDFHDNAHGNGATFWETRNVTITDTTSTSNKDFAFNFERVSGTVKIVRPVMSGNDQGDLRFASDEGSANVTIIDPKFTGSKLRIKVNRTYLGVANKQQRSDIHVIINGVDRTSSVVTWIS